MQNPLTTPQLWNDVSSGYARSAMQKLVEYAKEAVRLVNLTSTSNVLDVACGPGTLSLQIAKKVRHISALDFSAEMLAVFRDKIQSDKITNIDIFEGDGQNLPFADISFDAAFSMFGLMFFPDRKKGFEELLRTLKPGGRAVVSSWAPVERSPLISIIFGAIRVIAPDSPSSATSVLSMLDDPEKFKQEMEAAGFKEVQVNPVTKHFPVTSLEKFWEESQEGNARLLNIKRNLDPKIWKEKEKLALKYLKTALPKLPTTLSSDAWLAVGTK